ncbi:hypothetical protein [Vibrio vulnificus]|uniref:hypothetical protein n=1 Tax=Vibrio vulnificus TaxID=672 RepID=UPI001A27F084|nr:hypothetical protein [Vibrio vulnificus]MCA0772205.1 hypothetical protein [Vibrio vulnificus]HAS6190391.1 hypothetical protein [Vibrio vulnificus]
MLDSEETLIFSFMGSIYNLNIKSGNLTEEFNFRYGMKNPLYLVKIQGLEGFSDSILFGEYWGNPDNDEVKIYSRNLDQVGEWKEFTRFRTNEVLHIHNILVDKQQSRLLILTGDSDSQSGIWSLNSQGNLNCIVGGEQKFRSCFGFTEGFNLYYATDTPLESNSFMKLDLNTKMLTTITDIEGPVIYGTHCSEGALFSTSVEPDSRIKGWRYLLSTKPALDNNAHIFMFSNGRIIKLLSLEKDYLPMGLFQFGSVQMLSSKNKKHTYLYAVGLRGYDSMVFKFKTLGNENE